MIVQLRIDDRLIHGQVALVWSKELNTPGILVANDQAATNDTVKMTLKMACPPGIKLLVKTVEDAIRVANDPRGKDMRIFALTRNVRDALALVRGCPTNVREVNLANAGKFDAKPGEQVEKVNFPGQRVSLTMEELAAAKELVSILGDRFVSQVVPTSPKSTVGKIITSLNV